jgi:rare lipoprotein A
VASIAGDGPGNPKKNLKLSWLTLAFLLLSFACARQPRIDYFPEGGGIQTGLASWYGPDFHGKRTSNKEIYDMYDMTAAHNTLAFGTQVMVTNLENGRTATVRINDRGPFVGNRIIDLSYAAARMLGMIGPGTARVRLEILKDVSPPPGDRGWSVQVGSFISKDNAANLVRKLQGEFPEAGVFPFRTETQIYYRVRVRASDGESAKAVARRLFDAGYAVIILEEY